MGIIIKYILRNMWEKKLRTGLILFSIMISCGLFFSSSAIGDTFAQMYINRMKVYYGETDLLIQPETGSPSQWLSTGRLIENKDIEVAAGCFSGSGNYRYTVGENVNISLTGMDWEDLQTLNPVTVLRENRLEPFSRMKILLGKEFCAKYGYQAGDAINLTVNGGLRKFHIAGVVTGGTFVEDGFNASAVVPFLTLSSLYDARGAYNNIQIKLKDDAEIPAMLEKLSDVYKGYSVKEPIDSGDILAQVSSITVLFLLMTIIVAFMSIFIIYTSFKVITMERLPVIGTFRSIGASRRTTDFIMLAESFLYGVIGSGFGTVLGVLLLRAMSEMIKSPWVKNMESAVSYTPAHLITSFLFGVTLSFLSSFIPILQASKIPLKDIILNTMEKAQTVRMILIEALTGGLIGGIGGILAGLLMIYIVQYLLVMMSMPITIYYSAEIILSPGIGGLLVMLLASLGPSVKSSKLNIIEAVQYE